MDSLVIGIACYGQQSHTWWGKLALTVATLHHYDVNLLGVLTAASMAADHNRNGIVKAFLEDTTADWLLWIDTDNVIPLGGVRRLLDTQRTLVSGLYYLKSNRPTPVAHWRTPNHRYEPIRDWKRGEIIPADMGGLGCLLSHRSVYEDIARQAVVLQRWEGGVFAVHGEDIQGEIPESWSDTPPRVVDGILQLPVKKPDHEYTFPYFAMEHGRTEDVYFFELAGRCGHNLWIDTSVEVTHIGEKSYTGADYRQFVRSSRELKPRVVEYLDVETVQYLTGVMAGDKAESA